MSEEPKDGQKTFSEEIEVAGNELVGRVKELIEEGNVRRLIIRDPDGKTLLEVPLTAAVLGGGVTLLLAPIIAALGGLAAFVARVKIEIVREVPEDAPTSRLEKPKKKA